MANLDFIHARGSVLLFKACTNRSRPKKGVRAKYFYPLEALDQDYFCKLGNGMKIPARLSLSMLGDDKFQSQIGLLLAQLSNEGYDVSGAEEEFRAMRRVIQRHGKEMEGLISGLSDLLRKPRSTRLTDDES